MNAICPSDNQGILLCRGSCTASAANFCALPLSTYLSGEASLLVPEWLQGAPLANIPAIIVSGGLCGVRRRRVLSSVPDFFPPLGKAQFITCQSSSAANHN